MSGRLSTLSAALVVARRDFAAILFSRSFLFFLLGPLFPVLVGMMASGVGMRVQESAESPQLGIAMQAPDIRSMQAAHETLAPRLGDALPGLVVLRTLGPDEPFDAAGALASRKANVAAIVTGSPADPVLTGTSERIGTWKGPVSMLAAQAVERSPGVFPEVTLTPTATSTAKEHRSRLLTAQGAQTLLFLLTMLLAGMVLSNLVEEKGNKIIEILAAAIPMDSVFFGKLFAMLAISFVGIGVWATAFGLLSLASGPILPDVPPPAVGWPMFVALGIVYFAMAYLLLGSVFLAIGSMAATVREVQTLSMPVTMMQLMVFFLASYAMTQPGSAVEWVSLIFPFSSPFAMLARAAQEPALWTHLAAIGWQALCVLVFVRAGARMFRRRVMKSGAPREKRARRGFFVRRSAPAA